MGPSGSGKSTLLNVLGCLDTPDSGIARVDGEDLAQLRGDALARFRAEKIGFVFQQFHLVPYLTAIENVMLAQYFHSLADEQEAAEALKRVGLGDRLHHLPSELSGGEQQRVCVARALINQPNLILADEPTGNLDSHTGEEIIDLLISLRTEKRTTLVMATHDAKLAAKAPRTITLIDGVVAGIEQSENGPPAVPPIPAT
jgi:putative ABC transport system ATP-binding protein